jgi:molybdenum cofactor cytidylyltransferase
MTAAIVLCAGGSSRFGQDQHKLLAEFRGKPLVSWALQHAAMAQLDELIVVVGPVDLSRFLPEGARTVENPDWLSGQATSLQAGIEAAMARGHDAVVVGLGDQPLVPPDAWSKVAASGGAIAVATFEGRRTPPTRLARSVWSLLPQSGDEGARVLMQARPDLVQEVPCIGQSLDIDTVEDLARWGSPPASPSATSS